MSDLQISLLILGAVIIVAVVAITASRKRASAAAPKERSLPITAMC